MGNIRRMTFVSLNSSNVGHSKSSWYNGLTGDIDISLLMDFSDFHLDKMSTHALASPGICWMTYLNAWSLAAQQQSLSIVCFLTYTRFCWSVKIVKRFLSHQEMSQLVRSFDDRICVLFNYASAFLGSLKASTEECQRFMPLLISSIQIRILWVLSVSPWISLVGLYIPISVISD